MKTLVLCSLALPLAWIGACSSSGNPSTGTGAPIDGGADDGGVDATIEPDASDAGADVVDPWRCLAEPGQTIDPNAIVDVEILAYDGLKTSVKASTRGGSDLEVLSYTPLTGVSVTACSAADPDCTAPVVAAQTTDDAGIAHMKVHGDFKGYFELSRGNLFPALAFPGAPLVGDAGAETYPFPVLSVFGLEEVAQALGISAEMDASAGLGHALFFNFDCADRLGAGVKYTIDDGGVPDGAVFFYTQGQLPNAGATATDDLGLGGVVNHPAGPVTLTATQVATGRTLGTVTLLIRPATMTFAWVRVRTR